MPSRPGRPCLGMPGQPPCRELVTGGPRCPDHAKAYDSARGSAAARGYTSPEHVAWRRAVLARDRDCRDPDRRHPAERRPSLHADHIVPVSAGGTWTLENGQGLCHSCHSAKTLAEMRARGLVR